MKALGFGIVSFVLASLLWAEELEPRNIRLNVQIEKIGVQQNSFSRQTLKERSRQMLVTLDGREAVIFVGRRVPQVIELRRYLVDQHYVDYQVQFADIGTQLRARPRIRGSMIEVEITPEISYQNPHDHQAHVIHMDRLSSTVLVPNGGTIQLGSVVSETEFFDAFYRNEYGERLTVYLTPEVMD